MPQVQILSLGPVRVFIWALGFFYLAKCRYEHPYQAEPGRNLRSGLGFFFCPFARAYSVQLSFHLDQRQAAAPSRELLLCGLVIFLACVFRVLRGQALGFIISI